MTLIMDDDVMCLVAVSYVHRTAG